MFETRRGDLARLMHKIAFGDHHDALFEAHPLQNLGHMWQDVHGLGQHVPAQFE